MPENDKYLVQLIRQSCLKYASLPAYMDPSGKLTTYAGLENALDKNQFFSKKEKGLVAFYGDKNPLVPELFFSALQAGMAYLPIDKSSPAERVLFILKDSGARIFITESDHSEVFSKAFQSQSVQFEVRDYAAGFVAFEFGDFRLHRHDLAYVLYTSGSTGRPKGVMHTHESAMAFINWCLSTFDFKPGRRFISIAPFNFDLSIFDLFVSLASGGCLFIPEQGETFNSRLMANYIEEQKISVLYSTPSFFKMLATYGKLERKLLSSVSHILVAGEQLMGSTVKSLAGHFPEAAYYNLYGPTETNVCLYHHINPYYCEADLPVPIGNVCSYAKAHLTEKDGLHELWISGKSLMCGYIGEQLNLKCFAGEWYYNTGDLVERNNSGQFIFRGRSDRMVKRNGFRIEPAEIEACVQQCDSVTEASAAAIPKEGDVKIVVFFVATEKITDIQLRNFCLDRIPAYMLPDFFVQVGAMKLNANFKTDFKTLLEENDFGYLL